MSSAIYASTIGLGIPFSAAGGNLAVRKKTFEEVGGYKKIKHFESGDDKLLLNLIIKTKWKIAYNPETLVWTHVATNKKKLWNQQKRRYGKFNMSSMIYKILSVLIFLFYLYFLYRILFYQYWKEFMIYWISAVLFWAVNVYKHKERLKFVDFIYLLIYPYYLILVSILGIFGKWQWKN